MHEEEMSQVGQASVSAWRQLLAVCSLPGALVLPTAILHNWPWVRLRPGEDWVPLLGPNFRAAQIATPFEALLGAALATYAVTRIAERSGRPGLGALALVWGAALLAGGITGYAATAVALLSDDRQAAHSFPVWFWAGLLALTLLLALSSLGVFHLVGLACLMAPRLMGREAVNGRVFAAWVAIAAVVGGVGAHFVWFSYVQNCVGLGFRGAGYLTLIGGPYFAWGAGFAAYYAYRRLTGPR